MNLLQWIQSESLGLKEHYELTLYEQTSLYHAAIEIQNRIYHDSYEQQKQQQKELEPAYTVRTLPAAAQNDGRGSFFWGGDYETVDDLSEHKMLVGAARSGKTLLIHGALKGILPAIQPGSDMRAIIFDTKGDTLPMLAGMGIPYQYINICDATASAWDICADIGDSYIRADAIAHAYFPEVTHSDSFWQDGARSKFRGINSSFIYQQKPYTLGDICNACTLELPKLIKVMEQYPKNQGIINRYLKTESAEVLAGLLSTLYQGVSRIQYAAAHAQKSRSKVSLRQFLNSEGVLVVGIDLESPAIAVPEMQAMFAVLASLISASSDSRSRRTFIVLDEFTLLGKMRGLKEFVTFCPSKGVRVLAAVQSIAAVWEVYGKDLAETLLENFTISFLKTKGRETATYAQDRYGSIKLLRQSSNAGIQKESASMSTGIQETIERRILDSEFLDIPETNPKNGLTGVFVTKGDEVVKRTFAWEVVIKLQPPSVPVAGIVRRKGEDQMLEPWTEAQFAYFTTGRCKEEEVEETFEIDGAIVDTDDSEGEDTFEDIVDDLVIERIVDALMKVQRNEGRHGEETEDRS